MTAGDACGGAKLFEFESFARRDGETEGMERVRGRAETQTSPRQRVFLVLENEYNMEFYSEKQGKGNKNSNKNEITAKQIQRFLYRHGFNFNPYGRFCSTFSIFRNSNIMK